MNKEIFLNELRGYLQVLEDQEQDDILEEYAQHIDMKLQKGLSEKEAISDFGPVKELAAEILEAYHVKPEFQKKTILMKLPGPGSGKGDSGESFLKRTGRFLREKLAATGQGIRKGCRWIKHKCRFFGGWIARPFKKRKEENTALWESGEMEALRNGGEAEFVEEKDEIVSVSALGKTDWKKRKNENTERGSRKMRNFFGMTKHALVTLWQTFAAFCIWWLRFFWNAAWLLFSIFCGAMAMIVLMGIGAMVIFLIKGYPVAGLLIMSIGGLLCFGVLSMGALSLLIRKKKEEQKEEGEIEKTMQSKEEIQYE